MNFLITNGKYKVSSRSKNGLTTTLPRKIVASKITGAGDAFVAGHFFSMINNSELSDLEHLKAGNATARSEIM